MQTGHSWKARRGWAAAETIEARREAAVLHFVGVVGVLCLQMGSVVVCIHVGLLDRVYSGPWAARIRRAGRRTQSTANRAHTSQEDRVHLSIPQQCHSAVGIRCTLSSCDVCGHQVHPVHQYTSMVPMHMHPQWTWSTNRIHNVFDLCEECPPCDPYLHAQAESSAHVGAIGWGMRVGTVPRAGSRQRRGCRW